MTTIQINPNELSDKRVLVAGGTKGMGEAILQGRGYANVNRLRQAGATVITTARSKPDELRSPDLFIQSDISTPEAPPLGGTPVAWVGKPFGVFGEEFGEGSLEPLTRAAERGSADLTVEASRRGPPAASSSEEGFPP